MRAGYGWRTLLALALASGPYYVWGQTPDVRSVDPARPPTLFVTRLQEPATQTVPQNMPAASAELAPLAATTIDDRQPGTSLDGPRRISLTVARPMPVGALLLLLVNGTPFSLVDGDAGSGATFTGELKDLTMRQAIEAVLFPRELDYDVQGTVIRVFPRKTSTRLFNVNYLNTRRSLTREVRNSSNATLSSSAQNDLFDELEKGVQSLLSSSGRLHVDRTAGLVQVTDYADRLDQVGVYVEAVELRATRQVRIDTQVFEVTLAGGGASSIDWRAPAIRSATSARPLPGPGSPSVASTDIQALKRAIGEQGAITTIGSPQVVAMNNEPAIIRLASTASAESSPSNQAEGLTLTLVAQISADGLVQMHLSPSYATRRGLSRPPDVLRVNETDTLVRVLDGETVVLSGFLSESETGGAASAAQNTATHTSRSELVILLTPTIVRSAGSPR
jgi:hypothetical protein